VRLLADFHIFLEVAILLLRLPSALLQLAFSLRGEKKARSVAGTIHISGDMEETG
jgi:hypothetical protein